MQKLPAGCKLLAARVKLNDGRIGGLVSALGGDRYIFSCNGQQSQVTAADIAECGDDVKFRTRATCRKFGITYVTMVSLVRS